MWHHLLHLAVHAVKGYLERRVAQRGELPAASAYSFEQHMRRLRDQTGIPLAVLKPGRATFTPRFKGRSFITVLLDQSPNISFGMFSNVRLSADGLPPAVRSRLPGLSPGKEFELDTIDCPDDGTFLIANVSEPAETLTQMAFIERLEEMMLRLSVIDEWMVEQGHA